MLRIVNELWTKPIETKQGFSFLQVTGHHHFHHRQQQQQWDDDYTMQCQCQTRRRNVNKYEGTFCIESHPRTNPRPRIEQQQKPTSQEDQATFRGIIDCNRYGKISTLTFMSPSFGSCLIFTPAAVVVVVEGIAVKGAPPAPGRWARSLPGRSPSSSRGSSGTIHPWPRPAAPAPSAAVGILRAASIHAFSATMLRVRGTFTFRRRGRRYSVYFLVFDCFIHFYITVSTRPGSLCITLCCTYCVLCTGGELQPL